MPETFVIVLLWSSVTEPRVFTLTVVTLRILPVVWETAPDEVLPSLICTLLPAPVAFTCGSTIVEAPLKVTAGLAVLVVVIVPAMLTAEKPWPNRKSEASTMTVLAVIVPGVIVEPAPWVTPCPWRKIVPVVVEMLLLPMARLPPRVRIEIFSAVRLLSTLTPFASSRM